jgi:pyruvate dehydrogenase E1 component
MAKWTNPRRSAHCRWRARGLDNLVFVINCNLQRLDGPVRSNGRIIDELEAQFTGAGWNVIKVLWGRTGIPCSHAIAVGRCCARSRTPWTASSRLFPPTTAPTIVTAFSARTPNWAALAAHLSNDDIDRLRRGGHDVRKLHAAYDKASKHRGQPTVILAKTMKGFGMGSIGQGRMTTHQQKKLDIEQLKAFRDRFRLPLSDDDVEQLKFYKPDENSAVMQYLHARRAALGGYLPRRRTAASHAPAVPAMSSWDDSRSIPTARKCRPRWRSCACSATC